MGHGVPVYYNTSTLGLSPLQCYAYNLSLPLHVLWGYPATLQRIVPVAPEHLLGSLLSPCVATT